MKPLQFSDNFFWYWAMYMHEYRESYFACMKWAWTRGRNGNWGFYRKSNYHKVEWNVSVPRCEGHREIAGQSNIIHILFSCISSSCQIQLRFRRSVFSIYRAKMKPSSSCLMIICIHFVHVIVSTKKVLQPLRFDIARFGDAKISLSCGEGFQKSNHSCTRGEFIVNEY